MIDVFLLAGEPSGDLHGAALIEELLTLNPKLKIAAVAGPRMRKFPIECVEPMESLQVMGFVDVVLALPKIIRLFYSIRRKILDLSPKAFVGIDYPGFNLRLHRSLRKKGFAGKQIHYICPTVWAWGKGRIPLMAKNLDLLLTILPFEPQCFAHTTLPAKYVGHPLTTPISKFQPDPTFRSRFGFKPEDKILALFPGSRKQEVERNLPLMLKVAGQLNDPNLKVVLSSEISETYNLMHHAHMALAKSGTVVLELALHKTPTVVQYAIKPLDVFLATKVFKIKLPFYSIANLILQRQVFPELFGPDLNEQALLIQAENLWFDEKKRQTTKEMCSQLGEVLGEKHASHLAAQKILEFFNHNAD